MSNILSDKVRIKGSVMGICQNGEWTDFRLGEDELSALGWMVDSTIETTFSRKFTEWEIFCGPYINGQETGYIFQAINLYTRNVTTATVPFEDNVDVQVVKQALRSLLCDGGCANDEEEKKEVHNEL